MKTRARTLGAHLALMHAATFAILLGTALAIVYFATLTELAMRIDADLAEDVAEFARVWKEGGDEAVALEIQREMALGGHEDDFLILLDEDGQALVSSDLGRWPNVLPTLQAAWDTTLSTLRFATLKLPGQDAETRTLVGRIGSERHVGFGVSLSDRDELLGLLQMAMAGLLIVGIPMASLIVRWIARRATRGIAAVGATATAIASGELDRRVNAVGEHAEVLALATAFNDMADRNQKLIGDMRDMTDNVAHDLRGPLARIRLTAESSLFPLADRSESSMAAAEIIAECDRLMHLTNLMLDVSEAEAGVMRTAITRFDLVDVVVGMIELFDALAEVEGVHISVDVRAGAFIDGERSAIERLFANLLDNALKFTPRDGSIRVEVRREEGQVLLTVSDSGIGIAPEQLGRVFDRYYRADDSRTIAGCGLGLSYARAIARLHGGEIEVHSTPGSGATFRVCVPAARSGEF